MGFADYANKQELQQAKTAVVGLQKKLGKPDLSTPEGVRAFAESKGVETAPKQPGFLSRGIQTASDVLLFTSRQVGSALQVAKGVKKEDVDTSLTPSEVLFGKAPESESFGESLKYQFTTGDGLKRLATDIFLDPLTYLTLGTGSIFKIGVTAAGKTIAVNKVGRELVQEL